MAEVSRNVAHDRRFAFGDMVYLPFPFADADAEKNRWAFVLLDARDKVVVAYCTTNPAWTSGTISLGMMAGKVSNLVAPVWEVVSKERLILSRGVNRANLRIPGLLGLIGKVCRINRNGEPWYGGYTAEILEEVKAADRWVRNSAVKFVTGHGRKAA